MTPFPTLNPTPVLTDEELDQQLAAKGMRSVASRLNPAYVGVFTAHAGVCNLKTFQQWVDNSLRETEHTMCAQELSPLPDKTDLDAWLWECAQVFRAAKFNSSELEKFQSWVRVGHVEAVRQCLRMELEESTTLKEEEYDRWLARSAVFSEMLVNLKAAGLVTN